MAALPTVSTPPSTLNLNAYDMTTTSSTHIVQNHIQSLIKPSNFNKLINANDGKLLIISRQAQNLALWSHLSQSGGVLCSDGYCDSIWLEEAAVYAFMNSFRKKEEDLDSKKFNGIIFKKHGGNGPTKCASYRIDKDIKAIVDKKIEAVIPRGCIYPREVHLYVQTEGKLMAMKQDTEILRRTGKQNPKGVGIMDNLISFYPTEVVVSRYKEGGRKTNMNKVYVAVSLGRCEMHRDQYKVSVGNGSLWNDYLGNERIGNIEAEQIDEAETQFKKLQWTMSREPDFRAAEVRLKKVEAAVGIKECKRYKYELDKHWMAAVDEDEEFHDNMPLLRNQHKIDWDTMKVEQAYYPPNPLWSRLCAVCDQEEPPAALKRLKNGTVFWRECDECGRDSHVECGGTSFLCVLLVAVLVLNKMRIGTLI